MVSLTNINLQKQANVLDIQDQEVLNDYGLATQKQIVRLTNEMMTATLGFNLDAASELLTSLSRQIQLIQLGTTHGWHCILPRFAKRRNENLREEYARLEKELERKSRQLDGQIMALRVNLQNLDEIDQQNTLYDEELKTKIAVGRYKVRILKTETGETPTNDLASQIEAFEDRLYSLEVSKTLSTQLSAQLRLMKAARQKLLQQMQDTVNNALPAWKQSLINARVLKDNQAATEWSNHDTIDLKALRAGNVKLLAEIDAMIAIKEELSVSQTETQDTLQQMEVGNVAESKVVNQPVVKIFKS